MIFELGHLFFAGVIYLLVLFFIAYATEQGWVPERVVRHPATYALSLGVYATSWSFYGSVGFAQSEGFNFLSIYLGVTLAFLLAPVLLAPLLRLARDYQLASLADVFAFRYRSQVAGVLVTLFMLCASFPYIALQILAVTESVQMLTNEAAPQILALGFCLILILFATLFGARHISPREKHEGLVVAIAFESLVKLAALLSVGLFALFGVFGGLGGLELWLTAHPEALDNLYRPVREGPWLTLLFLSFCAAFLLPRQFHMTFVENIDPKTLYSATWAFPLFLLLLNIGIPIILWAGTELNAAQNPDFYVLGITLSAENRALTAFAFIGGVSAASAMVIVTTLALSSMCLNHLLLPASYPDPDLNLYRWVLWGRRVLIALIILLSYGFYLVLERSQGLVQLGLVSFVAVAQLLPGLVGLLLWPRATRSGFIAGLVGGGLVWLLTLVVPLLQRSGLSGGWLESIALPPGPGQSPYEYATLLSLLVNGVLFFGVSLMSRPSEAEREAANACFRDTFYRPRGVVLRVTSPGDFEAHLARILGPEMARLEVGQALRDLGLTRSERQPSALRNLRERIERNLSGLMGPMLAHLIVDERLQVNPSARTALLDNIKLIEERFEHSETRLQGVAAELDRLRRYHQQILQDLPLGVCSLGPNREVVNWNLALELMSGIERHRARNTPLALLPAPWDQLFQRCLGAEEQHLHKVQAQVNGRPRWFNLHKAAIGDPSAAYGQGGVVILVEDLTDLQTLESEVAHNERLASIGRLAAGVAHEIGNPVTGIACLAQNLESETHDEDTRLTSRQIVGQTKRITEIVQALVNFSHGGAPQPRRQDLLRLRQCVDEAARLVGLGQENRQVELDIQCDPALSVRGDRTWIVQVFVNLISNACDASTAGGVVKIIGDAQGDLVQVEISDGGEGIPPEILEQIFEPFVTTKPPGRGTGLGLALVHRIVQDHQGTVSVKSERGVGTVVTVSLPLADESDRPQAHDGAPGLGDLENGSNKVQARTRRAADSEDSVAHLRLGDADP